MDELLYEVSDPGIAVITIDRPERKNAMTFEMNTQLFALLDRARDDADVRAAVITGVPGSFCAGTDLSALADVPAEDRANQEGDAWSTHEGSMLGFTKPLICAVDGPAVGWGAELTSMCDIRIATPNARFAWNFVHRGLVPDAGAGTWLLPRLIGVQSAMDLLLSGEFLSADAALQRGYVWKVVQPDELAATALDTAVRLSQGSPFAAARVKDLVMRGLGRSWSDHLPIHRGVLEECMQSDDHREGVAAFLERRDPHFTGT